MEKYNFNKNLSDKLYLPKTNILNTSINSNSWFDITHKKYSNANSELLLENNITQSEKLTRCEKIEIYPTPEQKVLLNKWFEMCQYVYNKTIKYINKNRGNKISKYQTLSLFRSTLFNRRNILESLAPSHILSHSVFDAFKSYKSAMALYKVNKKSFRLRSKKYTINKMTMRIESGLFSNKCNGFCVSLLGDMESNKHFRNTNEKIRDCTLQWNRPLGRYFLFKPVEVQSEIATNIDICGIDPGLRTFQTIYSISNNECNIYEICNNFKYLNKLISRKEKETNKRKKAKLQYKLTNKITDLHYKTAKFICDKHSVVIIGKLSTKNTSKIGNKSNNKASYILSHYLFRQRLKNMCDKRGVAFIETDEAYTSKTCTSCGNYNPNLGSSKVYDCTNCRVSIDRDLNGARNILLKYITNN